MEAVCGGVRWSWQATPASDPFVGLTSATVVALEQPKNAKIPLKERPKRYFLSSKHLGNVLFINHLNAGMFKVTTTFQRMQSNHNRSVVVDESHRVQSYHNISKNAIESQRRTPAVWLRSRSKLPQHFKECNRITTAAVAPRWNSRFKVTTTFQRMQSNHNYRG